MMGRTRATSWHLVLIALLLAATAAFAIGVAVERSGSGHKVTAETTETHAAGETASESAGEAGHAAGESTAGFRLESTAAVIVAVVLSLLLAAALIVQGSRPIVLVVALFSLVFAALDIREVIYQLQESDAGVATLAGSAAALHVAVVLVAAWLVRSRVWTHRTVEGTAGFRHAP